MQMPTILLVDDSLMVRRSIALYLSEKYQVTACETAEEALWLVRGGFRPRLVITDLDLLVMPGIELIRRLQKMLPAMPLLAVSAVKDNETRLEALAAGAGDFLAKPFNQAELMVRIGKLLQRDEVNLRSALPMAIML